MSASPLPSMSVACPRCGERLGVRAADVGKRGQCRRCGAVFRLVGEARAKSDSVEPRAAGEGIAKPPAEAAVSRPNPAPSTVTFACELCETRLTALLTDVGKTMKCPDCGRRNVIPPPAPVAAVKVPGAMSGDQYGLWSVDVAPADLAARTPMLHPVECGLCQTLMYATDAQVGKRLKCPDCGTATLATARIPVKPRGPVIVPDGDEYQLDETSAPTARPVYTPIELRGVAWKRGADIEGEAADTGAVAPVLVADATQSEGEKAKTRAVRATRAVARPVAAAPSPREPTMPRIPLVQGVGRMLWTSEVLARWVASSIVLTVAAWFLSWILNAMGPQVFVALPMFAVGCIASALWMLTALPVALDIVTESSEGCDRLHDPPNWMSFDFAEAFFVAIAAAISAIPAWLTFKIPTTWPIEGHFALAAAAWLACFPIVLLSNLEQSSAFAVYSPRLGSSLFRCAGPWLLFYVESAALAAAVGGVALAILGGPEWLMFMLPWLGVAALFIYMRLLGRLAWWLAETMPAAAEGTGE